MVTPGRSWQAGSEYSFGYQGSLENMEVYANGNLYSTYYRDIDTRLGRWISIDPKASNSPYLSPYNSMKNNPILYNDPRGDEIPTTFYDEEGNQTDQIPSEVQATFNNEYGIVVGYNTDTKMLYQTGECDPGQAISESAKIELQEQLQVGCISEQSLVFGYSLGLTINQNEKVENKAVVLGVQESSTKTTYIDLADFENGFIKSATYGSDDKNFALNTYCGPYNACFNDPRTLNLARVLEHEYIGHGIYGLSDMPNNFTGFNPGPNQMSVNKFSQEIGLDIRITYGATWSSYNYKAHISTIHGIEIYYAPEYVQISDTNCQPVIGKIMIPIIGNLDGIKTSFQITIK